MKLDNNAKPMKFIGYSFDDNFKIEIHSITDIEIVNYWAVELVHSLCGYMSACSSDEDDEYKIEMFHEVCDCIEFLINNKVIDFKVYTNRDVHNLLEAYYLSNDI